MPLTKLANSLLESHNWRISDAAHKILAKDWTLGKDEHQSDVFERVLAFANAAKGLASTMELPVGQIAPETLLDTFTTKFHTLSENLRKASAQVGRLKFDHHQLSTERDALAARVAALQTQIQDASIRQAPRWNFFPSPAAFWNFRPNLAPCLLPNFGTPSCDWLSTQSRKLKARLPLRLLLNHRYTPHL
jgi:hypothetical protein